MVIIVIIVVVVTVVAEEAPKLIKGCCVHELHPMESLARRLGARQQAEGAQRGPNARFKMLGCNRRLSCTVFILKLYGALPEEGFWASPKKQRAKLRLIVQSTVITLGSLCIEAPAVRLRFIFGFRGLGWSSWEACLFRCTDLAC